MIELLSVPPFSRLPLHIRCFTVYAHELLQRQSLAALPKSVTIKLGLAGVAGTARQDSSNSAYDTDRTGPLDVQDTEFRSRQWSKWCERGDGEGHCLICGKSVVVKVSFKPTICL
jgi:structure-specific endonuclease subunit SLX1